MRSLAYDIARTRESQSGQMAGWLQVWGLSPTGPGKQMDWMRGPGHEHGATMTLGDDGLMPGMATQSRDDQAEGDARQGGRHLLPPDDDPPPQGGCADGRGRA
nr:DUF305 domain-containing protein [Janibacter limosus]